MVGPQGPLPDRAAVRHVEGLHAPSADDDGPAVDHSGHIETILARKPPDGCAPSQVETVEILRLSRRQQHATARHDRRGIDPAAHALLPAAISAEPRPRDPIALHANPVGKHRHARLTRLRIFIGPEQRAGGEVDGDHGTGAGRADEHPFGERWRQPGEPPGMAVTAVDRPVLVDLGERLRPLQPTGISIEHVEPDLPLLLDEHEELLAHGQRSAEIPGGCGRGTGIPVAGTAAGGKPPSQGPTVGDVVGSQCIAPLPSAASMQTPARRPKRRPNVHAPGRWQRDGVGMALDHEHQPTIARHDPAGGILEDAVERAARVGIGPLGGVIAAGHGGLQWRGTGTSLQPDPLPSLEVDCQQSHRGVCQDHAVDRQGCASRQNGDLLIGTEAPLGIEQARFLRVTCQRHAIPRREQWTRCRRDPIPGRIAAVHRPVASMAAGPALRLANERRQPGEATAGGKRDRDILAGDAHHGPAAGACLLDDGGRCGTVPCPQPRDGPHDRERGLEGGGPIDRREPIKPGSRCQGLVRLERLDRSQHRGTVSRWRVKPTSGDGHDPSGVVGGDGLFEHPIRTSAELQLVGLAARLVECADQPARLGLDALPRPLLAIRTKEAVLVGGKNLIEQRRGIAPSLVGDEPTAAVQLPFAKPVAGETNPPFALSFIRCCSITLRSIVGRVSIRGVVRVGCPAHPPGSDDQATDHQTASQQDSGPRVGECRPNPASLFREHQAGSKKETIYDGVPPSSATVRRLETPPPPAIRADHGRLQHRITGHAFGWRTGSGRVENTAKSLFLPGKTRKTAILRPETIFLGCIFIPTVSNRPRLRHLVPGSGSRWGTTAHNFLAFLEVMAMAKKSGSKPMTKTEIMRSISETTGLQKKDVVAVMEALTDEIQKSLKGQGIGVFSIPGLVKIERRKVPARPAQKGVKNPFTGELQDRPAKPASVKVRVRALKNLKAMVS